MITTKTESSKEHLSSILKLKQKELASFLSVLKNNSLNDFLSIFSKNTSIPLQQMNIIKQLGKLAKVPNFVEKLRSKLKQKIQQLIELRAIHLSQKHRRQIYCVDGVFFSGVEKVYFEKDEERKPLIDYVSKVDYRFSQEIIQNKQPSSFFNQYQYQIADYKLQKVERQETESWLKNHRNCEQRMNWQSSSESKDSIKQFMKKSKINFTCLNCMSCLHKNNIFEVSAYKNLRKKMIFTIQQLKMTDKTFTIHQRDQLQRIICSIINARRGYLFIGIGSFVDKDKSTRLYVRGIEGKNIIKNFESQFEKFVESNIRPKFYIDSCIQKMGGIKKCFQIGFIRLLEKKKQNNTEDEESESFIIRVKVDFSQLDPKLLCYIQIPSLNQKKQTNHFYQDEKKLQWLEVMEQIRHKFSTNREAKPKQNKDLYMHEPNIKCMESFFDTRIDQLQEQPKSSPSNNKYGRVPVRTYDHESLIMVVSNKEGTLKDFLNELTNRKILYKYYTIFETLPKYGSRTVYYITHEKRTEQIIKIYRQMKLPENEVHIAQIRKQFFLKNPGHRDRAWTHLTKHFKVEFTANITHGQLVDNNNVKQYFYQFANHTQATFAFTALEFINIRCNFCNYIKMQSVPLQDY